MATTYWQNQHSQSLILPTKEGTTVNVPQAGYVKDDSGTYYTTDYGVTSVNDPGSVIYAYTYPADPVDQVGEPTLPGGDPGTIQYNNDGEFDGIPDTSWDGSLLTLKVVNTIDADQYSYLNVQASSTAIGCTNTEGFGGHGILIYPNSMEITADKLKLPLDLPIYADNAAAMAVLEYNQLYRTPTGQVMITYSPG